MIDQFTSYLSVAWQAANDAGALLRQTWQEPQTIGYKGSVDLVTAADRQSERRIVQLLMCYFPEHSILAEEETNRLGAERDYRWIIDPLDGTTNFAHGYPHFAISIALEYLGETMLGVVYDPLRRECFSAIKGRGATLNGEKIRVSETQRLNDSLLATGFPYDRRQHADYYLKFLKAFMLSSQGIRRNGSAALDLCYVGCGRIDGFWELKLQPWDTAAGSLIVAEAGGVMSDFSGDKFTIWESETLASNGTIHEEMVAVATAVANEANS